MDNKEIGSIDPFSMDLEKINKEKLKSVFPECFVEDKLDIDKLLALCGEYIIEDFEKYKFEWKGKSECLQLAQKRSMGALRPCPEESVNFDDTKNIYIEGDNLEVLKLLQIAYFNKVKMIYIDPPYNTGHDFVYEDDYSDPIERYKAVTSQATKSNPETMGRFHTKWLNMMYPRLRLASYLLRDDGVIFISIDDEEVDNLKKVCNEVFGEENFTAQIPWQSRMSVQNDTDFSNNHEYILVYAKNRRIENRRLKETNSDKWFNKDSFVFKPLPLDKSKFDNPDNDPRGIWKTDPFDAPNIRPNLTYPIINPNTGEQYFPPKGRHWRISQEKFLSAMADNRIIFGKNGTGRPQMKVFYEEKKDFGSIANSWFSGDKIGTTTMATKELQEIFERVIFDTPKPLSLLKKLINLAFTEKDDIILDFFSGSATTAHAVMQLNAEDGGNRQFIMVQLPELCDEKSEAYKAGYKNICEIGKERIRRAGKKILDENNQLKLDEREIQLDVGFKVFKLDTSNLNEWNSIRTNDSLELFQQSLERMLNKIKTDRNSLDVVYEIILKMGFPLSTYVTETEISGKQCFIVGEECLILVCLDKGLTLKDVQEMAEYKPVNLIFSKQSFADNNVLINAHYRTKDIGIEIKLV